MSIKIVNKTKKYLRPYKWKIDRFFANKRDIVRYQQILNRILKKASAKEPINVLFILQYPEMWNSHKTVYDAFCNDERFFVSVLAVPKQKGVVKSDGHFESENTALLFCEMQSLRYINSRPYGKWINVDTLAADFVFVQRPYDECMPETMSLKRFSESAIVCYIPYGYEFVNNIHLEIEYNINFLNSVFCCFAENSETYQYIINCSKKDYESGLRKVFDIGYPRFDLIDSIDNNSNHRYSVLWTPRWSVSNKNDESHFFDYVDVLIDYFVAHPYMNLIIRPHPLMFKNFTEKGVMSEKEVDTLKERINCLENIEWDFNLDYLKTFEITDILISDFSSLVIEYFSTNKPVLYCGDSTGFNSIGKEMDKGLYHISSAEELINTLDYLSCHEDKYYEQNRMMINKYIKKTPNIGWAIKNSIVDTYLR